MGDKDSLHKTYVVNQPSLCAPLNTNHSTQQIKKGWIWSVLWQHKQYTIVFLCEIIYIKCSAIATFFYNLGAGLDG